MRPLISTSELADYLGIPVQSLYRWRQTGYGPPAIRVGKHLRYRSASVEQWIEDQADGPAI